LLVDHAQRVLGEQLTLTQAQNINNRLHEAELRLRGPAARRVAHKLHNKHGAAPFVPDRKAHRRFAVEVVRGAFTRERALVQIRSDLLFSLGANSGQVVNEFGLSERVLADGLQLELVLFGVRVEQRWVIAI